MSFENIAFIAGGAFMVLMSLLIQIWIIKTGKHPEEEAGKSLSARTKDNPIKIINISVFLMGLILISGAFLDRQLWKIIEIGVIIILLIFDLVLLTKHFPKK